MVNGNYTNPGGSGRGSGGPLTYMRRRWGDDLPLVTIWITLICVLVWLVQMAAYLFRSQNYLFVLVNQLAFAPALALRHPWTFVTSMFMHSTNVTHILFNMITLWVVGPVLERSLGRWRFLALYLLSGLGGDLGMMVYAFLVPNGWNISAIGASGALFGLFGAILVIYRRMGMDIRSMVVWMVINFCMPLVAPGIAWQDHVGGFLIGLLCMVALDRIAGRARSARSFTIRWVGITVVFLVAITALVLLCNATNPMPPM